MAATTVARDAVRISIPIVKGENQILAYIRIGDVGVNVQLRKSVILATDLELDTSFKLEILSLQNNAVCLT